MQGGAHTPNTGVACRPGALAATAIATATVTAIATITTAITTATATTFSRVVPGRWVGMRIVCTCKTSCT